MPNIGQNQNEKRTQMFRALKEVRERRTDRTRHTIWELLAFVKNIKFRQLADFEALELLKVWSGKGKREETY